MTYQIRSAMHGRHVIPLTACLSLLLPWAVQAVEVPFPPSSGSYNQLVLPQESEADRIGSFIVTPVMSINVFHDDNIYAVDQDPTADNIFAMAANLGLKSDWKRHLLRFSLSGDAGRYAAHPGENYQDYSVATAGRYDVGLGSAVSGGAAFSRNHEERGSPDDVLGDHPTIYHQGDANIAYSKLGHRIGISSALAYTMLDYSNVSSSTGVIDNDVRDRHVDSAAVRLRYIPNDHLSPFAHLSADKRTYIHQTATTENRDSSGYQFDVGLSTSFPNKLTGEIYIGWLYQNFDNTEFDTVSVPDYGVDMKWLVSKSSTVTLQVVRSLEETTLTSASSYLFTRQVATLEQKITADIGINLGVSRGIANFQMVDREDDYDEASGGIHYEIIKGAIFGIDYRHQERKSTQPGEDYVRRLTICYVQAQL